MRGDADWGGESDEEKIDGEKVQNARWRGAAHGVYYVDGQLFERHAFVCSGDGYGRGVCGNAAVRIRAAAGTCTAAGARTAAGTCTAAGARTAAGTCTAAGACATAGTCAAARTGTRRGNGAAGRTCARRPR